jgi:hypothetical protein
MSDDELSMYVLNIVEADNPSPVDRPRCSLSDVAALLQVAAASQ